MMGETQSDATVAVLKVAARSTPPAVQVMAPDVGWTEGDAVEGSLDTVAVAEWTGGELSLALTSGGSHSPVRGKPLLRWMNPQDPTSTLFALNDATGSMERESLDEGIVAMLKALDHARGTLREVIIPTGWVFTRPCLSSSFFHVFLCSNHHHFSVPYRSQPGEISVPSREEGELGPPHQRGPATWGRGCPACCRPIEGG